jgi:hypothetical protein
MRPLIRLSAVLALAAVLPACDVFTDVDEERHVAVIQFNGQSVNVLTAPATVTAGVPFNVTVTTYGFDCDQRAGAEVAYEGTTAIITPFDEAPGGNIECPNINKRLGRVVTLNFPSAGAGTIRVVGRAADADGNVTGDAEVTRAVTIN